MEPAPILVPRKNLPLTEKMLLSNQFGLHLRAAAKLARVAAHFGCSIQIRKGNQTADAKSVLSLIALAVHDKELLEVTAEGADAENALRAVRDLVNAKFGERE